LLDHFVNRKREGKLVRKQVRSIKSVRIDEILNVSKSQVDFELRVLVGKALLINKAYIRNKRDNRHYKVLKRE